MSEQHDSTAEPVRMSDMEAEHQLLHDLLHELQGALTAGRAETVADLLVRFKQAANLHFMEEQSLMRLHAHPGYAAHQQEHDELGELSRRITAGELADAAEAAKSLEDWLESHMGTTDTELEEYLEDEGIRAPSGT